jgi:hypothetical protein
MQEKEVTIQDYLMVFYGTMGGLAMTIANAIVCDGIWQIIWIIVSIISVICYAFAWFINFKDKDGFGQLLIYMVYSFVMLFAGCGTAMFTWGEDMWIFVLLFPFGLVGLGIAPFAIIGIIMTTVAGIVNYYMEHKKNEDYGK